MHFPDSFFKLYNLFISSVTPIVIIILCFYYLQNIGKNANKMKREYPGSKSLKVSSSREMEIALLLQTKP